MSHELAGCGLRCATVTDVKYTYFSTHTHTQQRAETYGLDILFGVRNVSEGCFACVCIIVAFNIVVYFLCIYWNIKAERS